MKTRHMGRLRWLTRCLLPACLALAVACGDDDNGGMAGTGGAGASGGSGGGAAGSGGTGGGAAGTGGGGNGAVAATLTIGDQTWEFDEFLCALDQPDFPFNASAFGEDSSGVRVQLTADISTLFAEPITTIQLSDVENLGDPTIWWLSESSTVDEFDGETVIDIDGDRVSGSGLFDDGLSESTIEKIPGTLEATCTETCSGTDCPS